MITASALQSRINRSVVFPVALILAGASMFVTASSSLLVIVVPVIAVVGFAAGPIYVLGFTLLHEHVEDELRGRIFAALLVLVRFCLLLALAVAPLLSGILNVLSDRWWDADWHFLGVTIAVPGVRLTLWLSSITVLAAGVLASWSLRSKGIESAESGEPGGDSR